MNVTTEKPRVHFSSPYHHAAKHAKDEVQSTDMDESKSSYSYPDGNDYDGDEHKDTHSAMKDFVGELEPHEQQILHKHIMEACYPDKDENPEGEAADKEIDLSDMTPEEQEPYAS